MTEHQPSIFWASVTNLALLLCLLRAAGFVRMPWVLLLAPVWLPAILVLCLALVACLACLIAAAIDQVNGASEKLARDRTREEDWERWR